MVLQMDSIKKANKSIWIQALAQDECFRADSVLRLDSIWPTPIAKCYSDLLYLMREGNVYGSLLQMRDLYETILKIPVLAALIFICGTSKDSLLNDSDLLEKWISKALSLGNWDALASAIINKNKTGQYSLPDNLIDYIKKTRKLISKKISPQYPNILNWRNDVIGHGALQFEDSDEYQDAIRGMLSNLKNYFEGQGKDFRGCDRLYEKIVFTSGDITLRGKDAMLPPDNDNLNLVVGGRTVNVGAFAKMSSFLFSSFYYNKRTIKYLDYKSGKDLVKDDFELREYVSAFENAEKYRENGFSAKILRREEEQMLSRLSQPGKYIHPESVFHQINQFMDENSSGIILLCMERGTGKSAFANSIDNLYHDPETALIEDTVIRSYSLGSAELRGVNDFINAINVVFTRSYNTNNDFRFSEQIKPEINIANDKPSAAMANVLNAYQEIYADEFGIYNLILVLDGVDEATVNTGKILDYLPTSDLLNEGVYIICTSRFEEEETVSHIAKRHIRNVLDKSDLCIGVRRDGIENQQLLSRYILQEVTDADHTTIKMLMEKSEYRMLYLKVQLALYKSELQYDPDANIASGYITQLLQRYNGRASETFKNTAAMLCLLGPITINDYFQYISKDELTYGFIESLNDLLPLLTVRGSDYGREYMLANELYFDAFADNFHDELVAFIESIKIDFSKRFFPDENSPSNSFDSHLGRELSEETLTFEDRIRIEMEEYFKERAIWILAIGRMLSAATKCRLENFLLTEDFVNPFLLFADMFIVNNQRSEGYKKTVVKEALQIAMNVLLLLADKKELGFEFSPSLALGGFTRKMYSSEGYTTLLNKIFNKESSFERINAWENIFFAQEFSSFGEIADYYSDDKILIEHIREENLLSPVIDMFSSNLGYGYTPYLLYIQSLDLDDVLMEKTMNLIVWSYLYDDFNSNYDEAENWLNLIRENGYRILYPDNKSVKDRISYCLRPKEISISEEMENLFTGFRFINADLTGVDYEKIDNVLNSEDPEIKNAALKELKICFDVANNIFEDGILPDTIWTAEQRSKFFSSVENGTADDSYYDEWAVQDQYTILDNCLPLLKYTNLVYKSNTNSVLDRWINRLDACLIKHNDKDIYKKLHHIVDGLYWTIDNLNENDTERRISYLFRYVAKYNTRSYLLNLWLHGYEDKLSDDIYLPSDAAITLLILYCNEGLFEDASALCKKISTGINAFNSTVLASLPDSDVHIPLTHYLTLYRYISTCRNLGFYNEIEGIKIDFRRELSALENVLKVYNKYSDLWDPHIMVDTILAFYKNVGADDAVGKEVLPEIIMILNNKICTADKETASELSSILEQVNLTWKEIYG